MQTPNLDEFIDELKEITSAKDYSDKYKAMSPLSILRLAEAIKADLAGKDEL